MSNQQPHDGIDRTPKPTDLMVVYEDPDAPEEAAKILLPAPAWLVAAKRGGHLVPIQVHWDLAADEKRWHDEGGIGDFHHDPERHALLKTSPRLGPLTEEQAIEYLIMQAVPERVWNRKHNRPMIKIMNRAQLPENRIFRDSWKVTEV